MAYKHSTLSKRFYNSSAWKKARTMKMARDPLCEICSQKGKVVAATQVHHLLPITKYPKDRLDLDLLCSLCDSCHAKVEAEERELEKTNEINRVGGDSHNVSPL